MNRFDGEKLKLAVLETLKRRKTLLAKDVVIFAPSFYDDSKRNAMWKAFLKKINVTDLQLSDVMQEITTFLKPIYDAIFNEESFSESWDCERRTWNS